MNVLFATNSVPSMGKQTLPLFIVTHDDIANLVK